MRFAIIDNRQVHSALLKIVSVEPSESVGRAFTEFASKDDLARAVGAPGWTGGSAVGAVTGSVIGSVLLPGLGGVLGAVVGGVVAGEARRRRFSSFAPGDPVIQLLDVEDSEDIRTKG
ncbi:hypothetical protein [Micromonospora palythoicola]|uniref:hypothetical protein n=1 Tax=Micromonospora palythoicola TaxID=3120507 RepID=UPI002FCE467F